jgi:hypothetical protein
VFGSSFDRVMVAVITISIIIFIIIVTTITIIIIFQTCFKESWNHHKWVHTVAKKDATYTLLFLSLL